MAMFLQRTTFCNHDGQNYIKVHKRINQETYLYFFPCFDQSALSTAHLKANVLTMSANVMPGTLALVVT